MWKSFILLLWLVIPLCGYYFLREDYFMYKHDCRAQRQVCMMRADVQERYSGYFESQAEGISKVRNRYSMRAWQRQWQLLQDAMEMEEKSINTNTPVYYPQTAALLAQSEKLLAQQCQAIEQAQRQQGFAVDLESGLAELEQLIYEAQEASAYYRENGSDSIYMFIQEILAQREAAYYSRQREYDNFIDNAGKELAKGKRLSGELQRVVAQIEAQMKIDEQRTYRQELRQRFAKFNLGEQLGALLSDLV